MITIKMQIHDEKRFEEITEFLGSEIVMRQSRFATIKGNRGSWLNLLKLCPLVLQLGHSHKEQTARFEDTSHLIDQITAEASTSYNHTYKIQNFTSYRTLLYFWLHSCFFLF